MVKSLGNSWGIVSLILPPDQNVIHAYMDEDDLHLAVVQLFEPYLTHQQISQFLPSGPSL